jgi:hypothetical protein
MHPEYAMLPQFDKPTFAQPQGIFACHQQDGHLCAGWVGCHDMSENLGLRLAYYGGWMEPEEIARTLDYVSPIPLFGSGQEAADHGMRDIDNPDVRARRAAERLTNKLKDKKGEASA